VVPWQRVRPTEPPFAVASGKGERRRASEADVQQIRTEQAGQEARRRTCEDNLKLRSYRREETECERMVREQKSMLDSMDWQAVMEKKNNIMAEITRIKNVLKLFPFFIMLVYHNFILTIIGLKVI